MAENQPTLDFEAGNEEGLTQWRTTVQPEKTEEPLELNFSTGSDQLSTWRREQAEKLLVVAQREGLPIGESVRILLQSDLELTGRLLINPADEILQVGGVPFQKCEIVSCVRLPAE